MQYSDSYIQSLISTIVNTVNYSMLKGKSILITGASGLIGSSVADCLIAMNKFEKFQMKIFLAGRKEDKIKSRFSNWINGMDYSYIQFEASEPWNPEISVDFVIHCASNAHPTMFSKYPVETITDSIIGTKSVLDFARKKNAGVLYVSSSEIYGSKSSNDPYKEDEYSYIDILNPRACYPSEKRACETLCACYMKEYGVSVKIVRPGHIYGPGMTNEDSRASAQFIRSAADSKDIIMKSEGKQLRSYCYVLDCVSAMLSVMLAGKDGEAYNISNRNSLATIREFADVCAELGNCQVHFQSANTEEKQSYNMMQCSALKSEKLEALGWKGLYDLESGIRQTLKELM